MTDVTTSFTITGSVNGPALVNYDADTEALARHFEGDLEALIRSQFPPDGAEGPQGRFDISVKVEAQTHLHEPVEGVANTFHLDPKD